MGKTNICSSKEKITCLLADAVITNSISWLEDSLVCCITLYFCQKKLFCSFLAGVNEIFILDKLFLSKIVLYSSKVETKQKFFFFF